MKYWDINQVVTKQRYFNFINGPRSIGKTYTLQKWLIKQAIEKHRQAIYVYRNEYERQHNPLQKCFEKVLLNEFSERDFSFKKDCLIDKEEGPLIWSLSLSRAQNIKRVSYPLVYYMMFDEYQIEDGLGKYINGWNEPELFINIYHTIDREEMRVKCFFLGNNASFYNPYHAYSLFGIPKDPRIIKEKGIWMNELTLFQMVSISDELAMEKAQNPFLKALQGTRYNDYANLGVYRDDNYANLTPLSSSARYMCTLECEGELFALYNNWDEVQLVFSDKVNPEFKSKYSLTTEGAKRGYPYLKQNFKFMYELLRKYYYNDNVCYTNMQVKSKVFTSLAKMM